MTTQKRKSTATSKLPTGKPIVIALSAAILLVVGVGFLLLFPDDKRSPEPSHVPQTAAEDHFYMPGEFDALEGLFLGGEQLAELHPEVMTAVVRATAQETRIVILTGSAAGQSLIETVLANGGLQDAPVTILQIPVMTMWLRDFGPLTVSDARGRRSMVEFTYRERRGNLPGH